MLKRIYNNAIMNNMLKKIWMLNPKQNTTKQSWNKIKTIKTPTINNISLDLLEFNRKTFNYFFMFVLTWKWSSTINVLFSTKIADKRTKTVLQYIAELKSSLKASLPLSDFISSSHFVCNSNKIYHSKISTIHQRKLKN